MSPPPVSVHSVRLCLPPSLPPIREGLPAGSSLPAPLLQEGTKTRLLLSLLQPITSLAEKREREREREREIERERGRGRGRGGKKNGFPTHVVQVLWCK
jgi:hypothetical protein